MRRVIREHARDFAAIMVVVVLGLATTVTILAQQSASFPSWVPILGSDHFELKGRFTSAQAITPGQGQEVTIAGIKVGTVAGVGLEGGNAIVTMDVDPSFASLIHPDAELLLRPRTGLQDMTVEIDPGRGGKPVKEGSTIPLAQTAPNVMPDQILASVDADTRSYLQLLLQAAGQGLGGNGAELAAALKRLSPTSRYLSEIGSALAKRRSDIAHVVTSLTRLSEELGHSDTQLAGFVRSSNDVLGAFANQQSSLRSAIQELPGALRETRRALASGDQLALQLGPASRRLIPAAHALAPALRQTRPLFRDTVGPIQHEIRPFARAARKPLRHVDQAARPLEQTVTRLGSGLHNLNLGLNALAYNPAGSGQEGYLFWLGWMNHDTNAIFSTQDAGGPLRHGLVLLSCSTALGAEAVAAGDPVVKTLQQLSNIPTSAQITSDGGC